MMSLAQALFWGFATLLVLSGVMTIFSSQLVHSALWLVLAFFSAAVLWVSLQAEFLGLVLVLVYVGAVMTLFLFVIMTLTVPNQTPSTDRWSLLSMSVMAFWLGLIGYALLGQIDGVVSRHRQLAVAAEIMGNTQALGRQLYTYYVYPFELAGVVLLVAIIASISLSAGSGQNNKRITKQQQLRVRREERVRLVKVETIKKL